MWPANIFFSPLSCPFHKKEVPTGPQNPVLHFSFVAITKTTLCDTVLRGMEWDGSAFLAVSCVLQESAPTLPSPWALLTPRRNPTASPLLLFFLPHSFWLVSKHSWVPDALPTIVSHGGMLLTARCQHSRASLSGCSGKALVPLSIRTYPPPLLFLLEVHMIMEKADKADRKI